MKTLEEKRNEFLEAAKPLIKYLNENHNPHTYVMVTNINAELLSGEMTTDDCFDFVTD